MLRLPILFECVKGKKSRYQGVTIFHFIPEHFKDQVIKESRYFDQLVQVKWLLLIVHFIVINNSTKDNKIKKWLFFLKNKLKLNIHVELCELNFVSFVSSALWALWAVELSDIFILSFLNAILFKALIARFRMTDDAKVNICNKLVRNEGTEQVQFVNLWF